MKKKLFTKMASCARIYIREYSFCRQVMSLAERDPCSLVKDKGPIDQKEEIHEEV